MLLRLRYVTTLSLLLLPLWSYADPKYGLENLFWLLLVVGGAALALTALSLVLTVLSYLRPHRRGLYRAQLVFLAFNALTGLTLSLMSPGFESLLPLPFNPYWGLGLPLGLWLNSVRWARQAAALSQRRLWAGVAVGGLGMLLGVPTYLGLSWWLGSYNARPYAGQAFPQALIWVLSAAVVLGSWVVVSRQLRARLPAAVWQPWWLLPLLSAGLSTAFTTYGSLITSLLGRHHYLSTGQPLYATGQTLLLHWVVGVAALRFLRPARHAAPAGW